MGVKSSIMAGFMICISFFSLNRYESEAIYFEERVRTSKRKKLEEKLLQVRFSSSACGNVVPWFLLHSKCNDSCRNAAALGMIIL